jgi:hypothetical protein
MLSSRRSTATDCRRRLAKRRTAWLANCLDAGHDLPGRLGRDRTAGPRARARSGRGRLRSGRTT